MAADSAPTAAAPAIARARQRAKVSGSASAAGRAWLIARAWKRGVPVQGLPKGHLDEARSSTTPRGAARLRDGIGFRAVDAFRPWRCRSAGGHQVRMWRLVRLKRFLLVRGHDGYAGANIRGRKRRRRRGGVWLLPAQGRSRSGRVCLRLGEVCCRLCSWIGHQVPVQRAELQLCL